MSMLTGRHALGIAHNQFLVFCKQLYFRWDSLLSVPFPVSKVKETRSPCIRNLNYLVPTPTFFGMSDADATKV